METPLSPPLFGALIVAVALPTLVILWVAVSATLAAMSGWPELANTFPGGERPEGTRLPPHSVIKVGPVAEKNATSLIATRRGLYLRSNPLFRFRRPPVFVPWERIHFVEAHRLLWQRSVTLDLGGVTTIRVRERALPLLREHGVRIPEDADA
jgi:hypothetical protein